MIFKVSSGRKFVGYCRSARSHSVFEFCYRSVQVAFCYWCKFVQFYFWYFKCSLCFLCGAFIWQKLSANLIFSKTKVYPFLLDFLWSFLSLWPYFAVVIMMVLSFFLLEVCLHEHNWFIQNRHGNFCLFKCNWACFQVFCRNFIFFSVIGLIGNVKAIFILVNFISFWWSEDDRILGRRWFNDNTGARNESWQKAERLFCMNHLCSHLHRLSTNF